MKFQLSPDNRDQPDTVLLEDLRTASGKIGEGKLSRDAYARVGRFSASTIANRFGGWGKALERAGLTPPRHFAVSAADAIRDLQRVARELGQDTVSCAQYAKCGRYSINPVVRPFGNWIEALRAAGLRVSDNYRAKITTEALFENLERVWRGLGRQPTVNDMFPPLSAHAADVYKRRFGGWRKALEAFVEAAHATVSDDLGSVPELPKTDPPTPEQPPARVRSVGWRLRYKVLERDAFRCRACGRSPALHLGTALEVDHIVAWSRGGSTTESNLQTLCEKCNVGKGTV